MNKSVSTLIRLLALGLLVTMALSLISCDKLPFDFGGIFGEQSGDGENNGENENPECQHYNVMDGKCFDCGEIFYNTVEELSIDKDSETILPDGSVSSQLYYVKATVKTLIDDLSGEMIIEDETGTIRVKAIYSEDGTSYSKLSEKPDEYDEVVLHCTLEKFGGKWQIKTAFIVSFEAVAAPIKTITVAEAIEICEANSEETTERYYIRATVTKVSNPAYGEMYIADETGEILVYNTKNSDGTVGYSEMTEKPVKGDEVLLYCTLNNYNGTNQVKSAWVIEFTHNEVEIDPTKYIQMSIADARNAEAGSLVKVSGVVAQITYANGYKPSGVILVDGTSSIYVYDGDIAGQVEIGNTIEVAAEKTYWVLGSESSNAEKFGYKGANQLDSAVLISNDKGNTAFDKSWITESTVKEIMDTPVTEDITNKIFKVNALVKKAPGNGFTNYYIDDIDGATGSYVYTQCNGGDFDWLDKFDGKICTVYVVAINAKSTSSGCVWRFLPIEVIDEGYTFNTDNAAEFAVKYYGVDQFLGEYTGDPAKELSAEISSELLGFEGATLSYKSSNEAVIYFTNENGVIIFHCGEAGTATVTITGSYNNKEYSETVEITVKEAPKYDSISIADAIAKEIGDEVIVKGIVGPSLVNQAGFYLFDESGMVAIRVSDASVFSTIAIGNEVVIKGTRDMWHKEGATHGQIVISNATVEANYYGEHDYLTIDPITDKDVKYIYDLDELDMSETTKLYVITATIVVEEGTYSSNIYVSDGTTKLRLYCSSSSQYSWLKAYAGQTVTVEIAPCNWNSKSYYTGCVLAVVNEDGSKVVNSLNFN